MFAPQRAALPHLETPAWIPHTPGESLRAYAARFARKLEVRTPIVIGGVSMGGMIALEIARVVPTRCVVLIASSRCAMATSRLLRYGEPMVRLFVPDALLDAGQVLAPLFLGRGGALSREHRRLLAHMAGELPVSFLRWAGRALLDWEGCPDPGVPVHHIHGDRDWVFPLSRVRPDRTVRGGIHVLNLSHPDEVNAFIAAAADMEDPPPTRLHSPSCGGRQRR